MLSNLLPSSLVSLVLCIPLSPLWFRSPILCSYPVLILDCVGEGFEKKKINLSVFASHLLVVMRGEQNAPTLLIYFL